VLNGKFVVTLCGSVKNRSRFDEAGEFLELNDVVALLPVIWGTGKAGYIGDDHPKKQMLEESHKTRIDLGDAILVINEPRVPGKSTMAEIDYARRKGKFIYFVSESLEIVLHLIHKDKEYLLTLEKFKNDTVLNQ